MIDLGSVYQVAVDVRNSAGVLADPGSATLTVTLPDGTTVTPAVTLPPSSTGQLRVDYVTTQVGRHAWRMVTTAPATGYSDVFDVRPAVPTGIVSLADARAQLNMGPAETSDDDELRVFIGAATGAVERALGRVVVRRSVTDRFTISGSATELLLRRVPVLSLTSVVSTDGATTWDTGSLTVDDETGLVSVVSGPAFTGCVDVTYQAGYVVIPDNYRLAGQIIVQHLWETQRGTTGGVQLGGGDVDMALASRGFAIPRRALELLDTQLPGVA